MSSSILPGTEFPDFTATLADGSIWRLHDNAPKYMLMIDVYRGYHCPRCRDHIKALSAAASSFAEAGMDIISVSMDDRERADLATREWQITGVRIAHDLSEADAARMGVFMSNPIGIRPMEAKPFAEPAVFILQSDLTLYGAIIQTFPFARPKIPDLLEIPRFAAAQNYPPRGDHRPVAA